MMTVDDVPATQPEEETTKNSIRDKTLAAMNLIKTTSRPYATHHRIPKFKAAEEAALNFQKSDEFSRSTCICINTDGAQAPIQYLSVQSKKVLLVQIPSLTRRGSVKKIILPEDFPEDQKEQLKTRSAINAYSETVQLQDLKKVDIVVMGSVAVSKQGQRIGKGGGYSDLEFAVMMELGIVDSDTIVVTTVHDSQVFDELPASLFKEHDVGVDLIFTPTQTIQVSPRPARPPGIIWSLISSTRLQVFPILRFLHKKAQSAGAPCDLKEGDSDLENPQREIRKPRWRNWPSRPRRQSDRVTDGDEKTTYQQKPRRSRQSRSEDVHGADAGDEKARKKRTPDMESRQNGSVSHANGGEEGDSRPRRTMKPRPRLPIDFSFRVSNIAEDVRVRDLKQALASCQVKPASIRWRGQNGFALLHFARPHGQSGDSPGSMASVMNSLRDLKISASDGNEINIEPLNQVTRIEVTDEVTAV